MEIILLQKINNLGELGDKVNVKSGYGRNYLIPSGKAVSASEDNLKKFNIRRAELEKSAAESFEKANQRKTAVENLAILTILAKAGTEGKLFGSVGTADIADAFVKAGIAVERREVRMPLGPIRNIGQHEIELHLHTDVDVKVKISVEAE